MIYNASNATGVAGVGAAVAGGKLLQAAVEAAAENIDAGEQTAGKPSLDVFARGASRTIVVFGGGGQ